MHITAFVNTFEVGYLYTPCITWEIKVGFDFATRSEVKIYMHLNIQEDWCDNTAKLTFAALFADKAWINWVTLAIGFPYLYLVTLSIIKSIRVYIRIRRVIMLLERNSVTTTRPARGNRVGAPSTNVSPASHRDDEGA